jgi:SPP1 family predicted phage head-tail adaptor
MTLQSGKLRHRITVQNPVYTQDSQTGAMTPAWQTFKEVWAAIEPLSARDFVAAQAQQSKVVARITIRYLPGITAAMRILHGSNIYVIEGILADKDSGLEYMTLPVSLGVKKE